MDEAAEADRKNEDYLGDDARLHRFGRAPEIGCNSGLIIFLFLYSPFPGGNTNYY